MSGVTSYGDLEALLRERFDDLTPNQQRIAQRLLSDPEGCAFKTVAELADSAGVNESTVVRFATALGLRGYPDVSRLCQERLREKAQLLERFESLRHARDQGADPLARAAALDQANIARTFATIDPHTWQKAVTALARARTVAVLGRRKSLATSTLLSYLLGLIRDEVHHLGQSPDALPDGLRGLGPRDVFVGISIHRYSRDTVRALEVASRSAATTIALTDNTASPLARYADLCFCVEVAGVSLLRSVTAFTSLAQALVAAVATEVGAESRTALRREEELLAEFDVYVAGPEPASDGSEEARG